MDDNILEKYSSYKKGEVLLVKSYPHEDKNEWEILKYMIGGYELINLKDSSKLLVETFDVDYIVEDIAKIKGHVGHEVVETYVSNPKHDAYLYCRDCKEEVTMNTGRFKYE